MKLQYNFFLRAKAWQIFLVFLGIIILSSILTMNLHLPFGLSKIFMPLHMLFVLFWLYVLGTQLFSIVPATVSKKLGLFKASIALTSVFIYLFIFLYFGPDMTSWPGLLLVILINIGFIYSSFFVAKNLVNAELKENPNFHNVGSVLILIWLFPIGIWLIQPRLQKIFGEITTTKA